MNLDTKIIDTNAFKGNLIFDDMYLQKNINDKTNTYSLNQL
jgi:hypothetical protein